MASIIKKKSKYSTYYVVAESARVDGKPRIVKQWYLGTIEKIIAMAEGSAKEEPRQIDCVQEGAIAVLFSIAEELGVREIVNQYGPKRKQGMSVGDYVLIAGELCTTSPLFFTLMSKSSLKNCVIQSYHINIT